MAKLKLLAEGKQLAYMAGRNLARSYSVSSSVPVAFATKADEHINELHQEMGKHRALHHPLFDYLEEKSRKGFTSAQYAAYSANYFHRTWQTIPSVARVLIAAAFNQDVETLASAGKNLFEETGEGNPAHAHSLLLERSHNIHASKVFGLPALKLRDAVNSPFIVPELHTFVEEQRKLYTSSSYPTVLGTGFAHEFAADPMLNRFYNLLFVPYKGLYSSPAEFKTVSKYFDVHLNGTEERHAADAQDAIKRACQTPKDLEDMRKAAFAFLGIQDNVWDGLLRSMREQESVGKIVEVRPEFVSAEKGQTNVLRLATTRTAGEGRSH